MRSHTHSVLRGLVTRSLGALALATVVFSSSAEAQTFVGSWRVFDAAAPSWQDSPPNGPLAYTGQEAAALLFGGLPTDYVISTVDNLVANINNSAWYDIIGYGGAIKPQNYTNKYLGLYYGPNSGYELGNSNNAASAFVEDNFVKGENYAFRVSTVPEPSSMVLSALGLLGLAAAYRRRAQA
jgi:PEP-CTERM motif